MADNIEALKQLQAGLNATFDALYAAKDAKSASQANEALIGLGYALAGTAMGGVFSVISLSTTPVHYMAVRIATDLDVFSLVASGPKRLDELAKSTGANSTILRRVLRVVSAIGWIKQTEVDKWEPSPLTHVAAAPPLKNWLIVHFDTRMETYTKFPQWLKKHNYQTTWVDDEDNIWNEANGGGGNIWEYMAKHPDYCNKFDSAMAIQEEFPPPMIPPYPFPDEMSEIKTDSNAVTLVDVGGGKGQAVEYIKKTYPNLPGRFVVQDLPKTIEDLDQNRVRTIGFEPQSHDFFTTQPVKGAKYYHLRRVIHDWNDENASKILTSLKPAMDPAYSKLLLTEFVLPDVDPGPVETVLDLMMMTACNGGERSQSEWHTLLNKVGFKIDRIMFADSGTTAVIEASLA